jgi:predicted RNase H-like HicB family nuclease
MAARLHVRNMVLFYPDPDSKEWVAHCLDFDLVGMGKTLRDAFTELVGTIEVYVRETVALGADVPLSSPAPGRFWKAAEKAEKMPDVDLGEITDWLDKHAPPRARRGLELDRRCGAALIMDRDLVPAI